MIRVFIGYDARETVAFHVAAFSIMRRSSVPVSVTGLMLPQLPMWRDRDEKQSTDFAFSRFLVPHMCNYEGKAIFMDCDMLCRGDIAELWNMLPGDKSLAVVKHDYTPKTADKFLNQSQATYQRKNWSSVMVFYNPGCRVLTPGYVNSVSGLELHQFHWMPDDQIHGLPREWNHLVGEYEPNPDAKLVHFTLGTPCFARYRHCEFAAEWFSERSEMMGYDRSGEFSKPVRVENIAA